MSQNRLNSLVSNSWPRATKRINELNLFPTPEIGTSTQYKGTYFLSQWGPTGSYTIVILGKCNQFVILEINYPMSKIIFPLTHITILQTKTKQPHYMLRWQPTYTNTKLNVYVNRFLPHLSYPWASETR